MRWSLSRLAKTGTSVARLSDYALFARLIPPPRPAPVPPVLSASGSRAARSVRLNSHRFPVAPVPFGPPGRTSLSLLRSRRRPQLYAATAEAGDPVHHPLGT